MSADSFHNCVENNMRCKNKLYDFQDYVDCVSNSGKAIEMREGDFFDFANCKSSGENINPPTIANIIKGVHIN